MNEAFPFAAGTFDCPVTIHPGQPGAPALVVMPAMGVAARKYEALAQALVAAGCNVLVADWPGQGTSRPRPDRGHDYGYRELVEDFVPMLLAMAARHFPGSRQVLLGHSLGGHVAALYAAANPDAEVTVIGVACGNIHYRHWHGRKRLMTPLVALSFNLMTAVLGYLPGPRIGFGGYEARSLIRQWGRVAFSGNFKHVGLPLAEPARVGVTSLFVNIEGDNFSPEASTLGLAALIQAPARVQRLPSPRPPHENPHSAWLRAPGSVAEFVLGWLVERGILVAQGQVSSRVG